MYTETVKFRFNPHVAPSKRFELLARLAKACEHEQPLPNHYYFTISADRNDECRVDFMAPSVFELGAQQIRAAVSDGVVFVTYPKTFGAQARDDV